MVAAAYTLLVPTTDVRGLYSLVVTGGGLVESEWVATLPREQRLLEGGRPGTTDGDRETGGAIRRTY